MVGLRDRGGWYRSQQVGDAFIRPVDASQVVHYALIKAHWAATLDRRRQRTGIQDYQAKAAKRRLRQKAVSRTRLALSPEQRQRKVRCSVLAGYVVLHVGVEPLERLV